MENRLSPQELVNKFKSIIAANVRRKNDLHEIIKTIDVGFKCEDRKEAGIKAEACGLYLEDVFYF